MICKYFQDQYFFKKMPIHYSTKIKNQRKDRSQVAIPIEDNETLLIVEKFVTTKNANDKEKSVINKW